MSNLTQNHSARQNPPVRCMTWPRAFGANRIALMSAKQNILGKLRHSPDGHLHRCLTITDEALNTQSSYTLPPNNASPQLRKLMEAVHTEIHLTRGAEWLVPLLAQLLAERELRPAC